MAEIRKHDPDAGDGLGKLVREALGEKIRPTEPGAKPTTVEPLRYDESAESPSPAALPSWPGGDGITFQF